LNAFPRHWKAGLSKVDITPHDSLWMAGYAARTKPSEGTLLPLYAKALALEDQNGKRSVLVTTDLLGFPAGVAANIAERVNAEYQIPRDRLVLNSSHTHCGPVLDRMLSVAYDMNEEQWAAVEAYTRDLENKIVTMIRAALEDLRPARLSFGHGEANFCANRRVKTEKGYVGGVNPSGPVDHDVPVLRIAGIRGEFRGVVFGYACHNTTLGADFYQFNGDYAGFAQQQLEDRHAGAVAMFVEGCGADANPAPRGTVDLARKDGEMLADAVDRALREPLKPVRGPLKTAWALVPISFAPLPTRAELEDRLHDQSVYVQRHARLMLSILDRDGRLPSDYPYPIQIWQFGSGLTFIPMAGEVVVDYDLRLRKELGRSNLWVAGYSNDVFAYIPSLRVLQEGGYEGGGAMIYYGRPGPFAPSVEETIVGKIHELISRCRGR
jgi:hypothetical protein